MEYKEEMEDEKEDERELSKDKEGRNNGMEREVGIENR